MAFEDGSKTLDDAIAKCLSGKDGGIVLEWLVWQVLDHKLTCPLGSNGTDPHYEAFRMGAGTAYRDLLDRAGYRITYERKPDERRSGDRDDDRDDDRDSTA